MIYLLADSCFNCKFILFTLMFCWYGRCIILVLLMKRESPKLVAMVFFPWRVISRVLHRSLNKVIKFLTWYPNSTSLSIFSSLVGYLAHVCSFKINIIISPNIQILNHLSSIFKIFNNNKCYIILSFVFSNLILF